MKTIKYYNVVIEYVVLKATTYVRITSKVSASYFEALFWERKRLKQIANNCSPCEIKKITFSKKIIYK